MKLLVFIFSLYMLVLPGLPCMDQDECEQQSSVSFTVTAGHTDHAGDDESCTPFCNCACCGQVVSQVPQEVKPVSVKQLSFRTNYSFYKSVLLPSDYFGNIWQPPRLS